MTPTDLPSRLQRELDRIVAKNSDVFSAALGVARAAGDFRWIGAAGRAYDGRPDEMQPDTPLYIASITKMYTAAAAMLLCEAGRLALDDPILKYLPSDWLAGLHHFKGQDYAEQLRVYHLVSQTSGLPDYFMEAPKGEKSVYDRLVEGSDHAWTVEEAVEIAKGLPPKFPPEPEEQRSSGKKAYYSDTNYQLLGAVIESAAGKPLHEVFTELILGPLALTSTYLHGHGGSLASIEHPPANLYYTNTPHELDKAMASFWADGGMVSTVADSLRFLGHFMDGKLFADPSTLEQMQSWRRIFFPFDYGLGLMRFKLPRIFSPFSPSPVLVGHSGASSAFLFRSDVGGLYIGGTLNQLANQRRPYTLILKVIQMVGKALA